MKEKKHKKAIQTMFKKNSIKIVSCATNRSQRL